LQLRLHERPCLCDRPFVTAPPKVYLRQRRLGADASAATPCDCAYGDCSYCCLPLQLRLRRRLRLCRLRRRLRLRLRLLLRLLRRLRVRLLLRRHFLPRRLPTLLRLRAAATLQRCASATALPFFQCYPSDCGCAGLLNKNDDCLAIEVETRRMYV
jgi:hypothetical protein